jgi:LPXTG-site transpeptidase (sortase) family protein
MNSKTLYRVLIGALYVAIIFFALPDNKTPVQMNVTALAAVPSSLSAPAVSAESTEYGQNKEKKIQAGVNAKAVTAKTVPVVYKKALNTEVKKAESPIRGYPYTLSIPSINVNAGIRAMGLESDGKMAVPNNYTEVGWYSLGTKPGRTGNAVLGAHVDNGAAIGGVFKNLKKLTIGDDIYVKDEQGKTLHYRVVERKVYDYRHRDTSEVFGATNKAMLNLITCHGNWLSSENTYDQRLIVFAELVA